MEGAPRYKLLTLLTLFPWFALLTLLKMLYTAKALACLPIYESFSDVGESQVWFASKNLTPCRMH